jgi:hypothetical protein
MNTRILSDDAIALSFADSRADSSRYDMRCKRWLHRADDGRWFWDETLKIFALIRQHLREIDPALGSLRRVEMVERLARSDQRLALAGTNAGDRLVRPQCYVPWGTGRGQRPA